MAGRQLGKFRQWAGEVISSREKTQPSSEFIALEKDIDARRDGLGKLQIVSTDYMESIARKIQSEAIQGDDKLMVTETLGVVMIRAGEKLGAECALGRCLSMFGRAYCRIAAIQNIFAVTLGDTFIAHLGRSLSVFEEYATLRKKLESRRLAYDAAITKSEKCKNSKKEKDRREAEDELENARLKYEEAADELKESMDAITDAEVAHQRELRRFLDLETKSVEQHLDALREVQRDWPEIDFTPGSKRDSRLAFPHAFDRTSSRSSDSHNSAEAKSVPPPVIPPRPESRRSTRSVRSVGKPETRDNEQQETAPDEPISRPMSRISRKLSMKNPRSRSDSAATQKSVAAAAAPESHDDDDEIVVTGATTPSKANGRHKKAGSSVVSAWVGDAMSSVMSRSKPRVTDKETFSALADDDGDGDVADDQATEGKRSRRSSVRSTKSRGSVSGDKKQRRQSVHSIFDKTTNGKRAIVKAVSDFQGSQDELSFKVGDEIVVLQETVDEWWLGEMDDGRKGLFPADRVVAVKRSNSQTGLAKSRNASASSILGLTSRGRGEYGEEEKEIRRTLVGGGNGSNGYSNYSDSELTSDAESVDRWESFEDLRNGGGSLELDQGQGHLKIAEPPLILPDIPIAPSPSAGGGGGSPVKKVPPPPPPRRVQSSAASSRGPPPLPERNVRAQSSSAINLPNAALAKALQGAQKQRQQWSVHSETSSPFESQSELSFETVAKTPAYVGSEGGLKCLTCACDAFVEDPFRGHGLCANCTHEHE